MENESHRILKLLATVMTALSSIYGSFGRFFNEIDFRLRNE